MLIELKSVSDLLGSMRSKRLVAQAHGIAETADLAFIMVRGRYTEAGGVVTYQAPGHPQADSDGWVRSGWNWDAFQAIKTDITLLGVDFIDCPNENDAAREIVRLVTTLSKDEHKWLKQRTRPEVLTLDKAYENAVWSLAAFDGIGPDTAEAMLKAYGSVAAIVNVAYVYSASHGYVESAKQMARKVDGLGPKRAQRFIEEVTQQWSTTNELGEAHGLLVKP
jgi:ERCC4-type nuclease